MPAKILLAAALLLGASPAMAEPAPGTSFQTIHAFDATDGAFPEDTPTLGADHALYGTTIIGGTANDGVVYQLDAQTGGVTPLYSFRGGRDGNQPQAGVTAHGRFLFGTTYYGGGLTCHKQGCGIVYRVDMATGQERVLHRFKGKADGRVPSGGKLVYAAGALYGTTEFGGSGHLGTLYRVDPGTGATQILHDFTGGADGRRPQGALIETGGMIYGTTFEGGAPGCRAMCGTLFRINPAGRTLTTLHAFTGATDAQYPFGPLAIRNGILYGASLYGGTMGHGAIFAFDLTAGSERVLFSFTSSSDGAVPTGVTYDGGFLYGGTLIGGIYDYGVAWRIDPQTGAQRVLHAFSGNADGGLVYGAPLVFDGALYGTTYQGADFANCAGLGCGTVFKITVK